MYIKRGCHHFTQVFSCLEKKMDILSFLVVLLTSFNGIGEV